MYQLYLEQNNEYSLYGEYNSEKDARKAIVQWCIKHNFESCYWNCYTMPYDSILPGGTHIDFGSWDTFFIIKEKV